MFGEIFKIARKEEVDMNESFSFIDADRLKTKVTDDIRPNEVYNWFQKNDDEILYVVDRGSGRLIGIET
jgi:hypothetical protein